MQSTGVDITRLMGIHSAVSQKKTVSKTLVMFRTPLFLPSLAIQWFFQHRFAHQEFEQA